MFVPEVLEHYHYFKIELIDVYVGKNVYTISDVLKICTRKVFFIESLDIKGIRQQTF